MTPYKVYFEVGILLESVVTSDIFPTKKVIGKLYSREYGFGETPYTNHATSLTLTDRIGIIRSIDSIPSIDRFDLDAKLKC